MAERKAAKTSELRNEFARFDDDQIRRFLVSQPAIVTRMKFLLSVEHDRLNALKEEAEARGLT